MDERALHIAGSLVSPHYVAAGAQSLQSHSHSIRSLLAQRRCPEKGLSDEHIELLLLQLSLMDTNNFPRHVGAGEREGRIASSLVRRRVYGMTHGVGRSGDLSADQPKAAGSTLLAKLANAVMLDLVRLSGAPSTKAAAVVPMATGMTLSLVLRCIANSRRQETEAAVAAAAAAAAEGAARGSPPEWVIWPRIDQKTCLKCIEAAGLRPCVVPLRTAPPPRSGTATVERPSPAAAAAEAFPAFLQVHVDDVRAAIERVGGPASVVCVLSTTSCFAPRLPDDVVAISRLCEELGVPHVVNNAYGVQSKHIMHRIDAALRLGRLDYFIQSGDKNFLVPVGGAVLCSGSEEKLKRVMALYAGRASAAPATDLLITALGLGREGMQKLWDSRYERRKELEEALLAFAEARGETLLREQQPVEEAKGRKVNRVSALPRNDISFCLTVRHYHRVHRIAADKERSVSPLQEGRNDDTDDRVRRCEAARSLGAKLFRGAVTGPRVVTPSWGAATNVVGCLFFDYGMHYDHTGPALDEPAAERGGTEVCPLLVLACGIGMTKADVVEFMARLEKLWPVAAAALTDRSS